MLQFAQQIFNQIRTACGIICTLKHFEEKKAMVKVKFSYCNICQCNYIYYINTILNS